MGPLLFLKIIYFYSYNFKNVRLAVSRILFKMIIYLGYLSLNSSRNLPNLVLHRIEFTPSLFFWNRASKLIILEFHPYPAKAERNIFCCTCPLAKSPLQGLPLATIFSINAGNSVVFGLSSLYLIKNKKRSSTNLTYYIV